jgi:hypothetical protein
MLQVVLSRGQAREFNAFDSLAAVERGAPGPREFIALCVPKKADDIGTPLYDLHQVGKISPGDFSR